MSASGTMDMVDEIIIENFGTDTANLTFAPYARRSVLELQSKPHLGRFQTLRQIQSITAVAFDVIRCSQKVHIELHTQ